MRILPRIQSVFNAIKPQQQPKRTYQQMMDNINYDPRTPEQKKQEEVIRQYCTICTPQG